MNNTATAIKYDFSGWSSGVYRTAGPIRSQYFLLLYALCIAFIILLIYKIKGKKISYLPETGVAILIGSLVSFIALHVDYKDMANVFDPDFFFWFLLPPVIFQAGFVINHHNFFSNWFAIMVFANVGTVVSTVVFGYLLYLLGLAGVSNKLSVIECLCFGSLISATDPVSTLSVFSDLNVEPALYAIVYGSSAIDDAVAIIMFRSFQKYISKDYLDINIAVTIVLYLVTCVVASSIIGIFIGGIAALIIKKNNPRGKYVSAFVFCLIYISYFLCTMAQLSGIISCMFAAISFKYCLEIGTILDVDESITIDAMLSFVAYLSETVIFFCIGMSTITSFYELHENFYVGFTFWALLLTIISRAVFVYPLSYLSNLYNGGFLLACYSQPEFLKIRGRALTVQQEEVQDNGGQMKLQKKIISKLVLSDTDAIYISRNEQHMIVFAGLRGPIAYAAASQFREKTANSHAIYLATLVIVLFNVFINGSLTEIALRYFGIKYGDIVYKKPIPNIRGSRSLPSTRLNSFSSCNTRFSTTNTVLSDIEEEKADLESCVEDNLSILIPSDASTRLSTISSDNVSLNTVRNIKRRSSKVFLEWFLMVEKCFIIPLFRDGVVEE